MEKHDATWLAAAIDGEGTISSKKDEELSGRWMVVPFIQIVNTGKVFCERAKEIANCGVITGREYVSGTGMKTLWKWKVESRKDVESVLNCVVDFLVLKKNNALDVFRIYEKKDKLFKEYEELQRIEIFGVCWSRWNGDMIRGRRRSRSKKSAGLCLGIVNNSAKGWRGDSVAHSFAARRATNHGAKGWYGDKEAHSRAARGLPKDDSVT
jgi:hypothetical protein